MILIRGDNLRETAEVKFNGVPAEFKVSAEIFQSRFMVIAWVPEDATTGPITLTTPHGSFTTAESFVIEDGRPSIERFSPTSGPPGTSITIYGSNLAYATSVQLNGLEMKPWTYHNAGPDGVLFAFIPANATTGPITVISPHGTAASAEPFTVAAHPPFTVLNWPKEVEAEMSIALEVNDNFLMRDVRLNGTSIPFATMTKDLVFFTLPENAVSGPLTVVTTDETVTSPEPLIVHPKPVVLDVQPRSGLPGVVVQVVGSNLQNVDAILLGGVAAPFDKETLTFTVPPNAKGSQVAVRTRFSTRDTSVRFYIVRGRISTSSGTIRGTVPTSEPQPVTGIIPAVRERARPGFFRPPPR